MSDADRRQRRTFRTKTDASTSGDDDDLRPREALE